MRSSSSSWAASWASAASGSRYSRIRMPQDLQRLGVVVGGEPDQQLLGPVRELGRHRLDRGPDHPGLLDQHVPGRQRRRAARAGSPGPRPAASCGAPRSGSGAWSAPSSSPSRSRPTSRRPRPPWRARRPGARARPPAPTAGSAPPASLAVSSARHRPDRGVGDVVEAWSWMAATVFDTRCRGESVTIAVMTQVNTGAPTFEGPKRGCPQATESKGFGAVTTAVERHRRKPRSSRNRAPVPKPTATT